MNYHHRCGMGTDPGRVSTDIDAGLAVSRSVHRDRSDGVAIPDRTGMTAQLAAFATDVEELSADRATHRPGLSADFTRRGVPAVGPPDRSLQLGRQVVGSRIVPLNLSLIHI